MIIKIQFPNDEREYAFIGHKEIKVGDFVDIYVGGKAKKSVKVTKVNAKTQYKRLKRIAN